MTNLKFIRIIILNNFRKVYENFKIIFLSKNKIILLLLMTPITYIIIKIQIYTGIIFLIYYILQIILIFSLKTNKNINCEELSVNTDRLLIYSVYNIFFAIPKAKAFIVVYELLYFIKNKNIKKKNIIVILLPCIFIIYLIKLSILFILGVSYISILITSNTVITFDEIFKTDSISNKAKYQHILMNCFILISDTISSADQKKIIFENNNIILNAKSFWEVFFLNTKNPEIFLQNYYNHTSKNNMMYINDHYGFYQTSEKYKDINLGVNLTSKNNIYVNNEKIKLFYGFKPNLIGQNKPNYFTIPYIFGFKKNKLEEFPKNFNQKANSLKSDIDKYLIECKNEKILELENKKFFVNDKNVNLEEFSKEYAMPIYFKIVNMKHFEYINQEWLNTPEGRNIYEKVKNDCRENKFNYFYNYFDKEGNENI